LELLKAIDKDSLSLRAASVKFNTPDTSIIVKWKKDFAVFGLVVLQSKPGADQKL
jgi:transposase